MQGNLDFSLYTKINNQNATLIGAHNLLFIRINVNRIFTVTWCTNQSNSCLIEV